MWSVTEDLESGVRFGDQDQNKQDEGAYSILCSLK